MIKKKAKNKAAAKKPTRKSAGKKREAKDKPETNPAEVRKEISKLVTEAASKVAAAVIDVAKTGQLAPAKYLFEMASIFPPAPNGEQATTEEDCLAKMLLSRIEPAKKEGGSETNDPGTDGEAADSAQSPHPTKTALGGAASSGPAPGGAAAPGNQPVKHEEGSEANEPQEKAGEADSAQNPHPTKTALRLRSGQAPGGAAAEDAKEVVVTG